MRSFVRSATTLAALLWSLPSAAEWMRADTDHFIVYSDDKPARVQALATDLEVFDAVLRRFHKTAEQDGAASNKLTVFVADDVADIQRLCGRCGNVYGFYSGRATGSIAFTPRWSGSGNQSDLKPRAVLYHEYAHHFLFGNYAMAYPAWFSEGYAEFTSTFRRNDVGATIGAAPMHRADGLFGNAYLSATEMFDPVGRKLSPEQQELIYGRGWLLTHYLMFEPKRRGQLERYLQLVNGGTPSLKAATEAFGKLDQLDRELNVYLRRSSVSALTIRNGSLPTPTVTLRPLTPGEAALIDLRMTSVNGVSATTAKPLYNRARGIAARYPDDAVAQGWLAEMAFDAGATAEAEAAADRALAVDRKSVQALMYKGFVGLRRAADAKAPAASFTAARRYLIEANKVDPDNAAPLVAFYRSFGQEGRAPTANAVKALLRAQELAPQDDGLRATAVSQLIRTGDLARAKVLLRPLAYNPHAKPDNDSALLLAALDGDQATAIARLDAVEAKANKGTDAKK